MQKCTTHVNIVLTVQVQHANYHLKTLIAKDRNTRDHLAWIAGKRSLMHGVCIPHRIPSAYTQQGWNKRQKQTQE